MVDDYFRLECGACRKEGWRSPIGWGCSCGCWTELRLALGKTYSVVGMARDGRVWALRRTAMELVLVVECWL